MKMLSTAVILSSMVAAPVMMASTPVKTLVPVESVFAPLGFDSNDNSEVVVSGWLPNLCHKSPSTKVTVNGNNIDIQVSALKYETDNPFCPEIMVPFLTSVDLGILDKGDYKIRVNPKTMFENKTDLSVSESTSPSVDDYTYASVESVDKIAGTRDIVLKGYNPSDCFVLDRVQYVSNGKDTYSVLPIMKQISNFCPMKLIPFNYQSSFPSDLKSKKILLHVRVMDGRSVNSVWTEQAGE